MTLADQILELARTGHSTPEIAGLLDVRFDHVRRVVAKAGVQRQKPLLAVETLVAGGFTFLGNWRVKSNDRIELDRAFPEAAGTYALVVNGRVSYIGVATAGLGRRLRMYTRSSERRKTWARIHGLIREVLVDGGAVEV